MDDNNHKSVVNTAGENLDNKQGDENTWLIIKVNINFYLVDFLPTELARNTIF